MYKFILPVVLAGCVSVPPAEIYPVEPAPLVRATQIPPLLVREDISVALNLSHIYRRPLEEVQKIVRLAEKHADPVFPTKEQILAVIAVESSFKPGARNKGSFGLMQIQERSHRARIQGRSLTNPEVNVEVGVSILKEYYLAVGRNPRAALLAYNAGVGGYRAGRYNNEYYRKVNREVVKISKLSD